MKNTTIYALGRAFNALVNIAPWIAILIVLSGRAHAQQILTLSQTSHPLMFFMESSTGSGLGVTGLSPTVTLSKDGGSFASPSGAVSEIANGWYKVAGNATDEGTDGTLILYATGTAAFPATVRYVVRDTNIYDATRGGMTALPNANATSSGGLLTSGTGSNQISTSSGQMLVQSGTSSGQISVTSGIASVNVTQVDGSGLGTHTSGYFPDDTKYWNGHAVPSENVSGVPLVDAKYLLGTIFATPATAGVLDANVKNYANTAAAVDGNGWPKMDAQDWQGTATQLNGSYPKVDASFWGGVAPSFDASNFLKVDVEDWAGSLQTAGAIPSAVAGSSGGLLIDGSNAAQVIFAGGLSLTSASVAGLTIATTNTGHSPVEITGQSSNTGMPKPAVAIVGGAGGGGSGFGGVGVAVTGGASSNTHAAGDAYQITGGANSSTGAAGAGEKVTTGTGSSATAVAALSLTVATTNGDAITATHAGTGKDINGVLTEVTLADSVSGSVGSVTGSVGSVVGAVGSVTGSVGSISGITFPARFSSLAIDSAGAVTLTAQCQIDLVNEVLNSVIENDGATITLKQGQELMFAVLCGQSSGGGTRFPIFYSPFGVDVDHKRISTTLDDLTHYNRTAVTRNP